MRLLPEGLELWSLDDSLRTYVPELPDYADAITIRHLIHHTSGLRDYPTLRAMAGASADLTERQFHSSDVAPAATELRARDAFHSWLMAATGVAIAPTGRNSSSAQPAPGPPAAPPALSSEELRDCRGRYYSEELEAAYELAASDGALRFVGRSIDVQMLPIGKDRFRWSS